MLPACRRKRRTRAESDLLYPMAFVSYEGGTAQSRPTGGNTKRIGSSGFLMRNTSFNLQRRPKSSAPFLTSRTLTTYRVLRY